MRAFPAAPHGRWAHEGLRAVSACAGGTSRVFAAALALCFLCCAPAAPAVRPGPRRASAGAAVENRKTRHRGELSVRHHTHRRSARRGNAGPRAACVRRRAQLRDGSVARSLERRPPSPGAWCTATAAICPGRRQPLFDRAAAALADYGLPPEVLRHVQAVAAMLAAVHTAAGARRRARRPPLQRRPCAGQAGVFPQKPWNEQIRALEDTPEADQVKCWQATVDDTRTAAPDRRLMAAYLARDLGRLRQIGEQSSHGTQTPEDSAALRAAAAARPQCAHGAAHAATAARGQCVCRGGGAASGRHARHTRVLQAQGWQVTPVY